MIDPDAEMAALGSAAIAQGSGDVARSSAPQTAPGVRVSASGTDALDAERRRARGSAPNLALAGWEGARGSGDAPRRTARKTVPDAPAGGMTAPMMERDSLADRTKAPMALEGEQR